MRILILNWRCPRNPSAGGAELVTHEIARRLVARGHQVEWFSASFPGAAGRESIDGIDFVRNGRQWTVHLEAFRRYRARISRDFDVVVDQVNTVPFFTPLWARIPTVMLIHQLAREVWWYESAPPISTLGYLIEPIYLRLYTRTPVLTVSQSTSRDLTSLGFRGPITIFPIGIQQSTQKVRVKSSSPTFLYVGRLAPSKRIDHMIEALAHFRQSTGVGRLLLAGEGTVAYRESLSSHARRLRVDDAVQFLGRVSDDDKHRLMAESHALLMTSVREGWGLVVTEAAAQGTPAVVYDVPGLHDSVRNEETGLVVPAGRPKELAASLMRLISDTALYSRLSVAAELWSASFSFDAAADLVAQELTRTVASRKLSVVRL